MRIVTPEQRARKLAKWRAWYAANPEVHCARSRAWYAANRDKKRAMEKARVQAYPAEHLLRRARYRARKYNIAFSLTLADITIPESCPILGMKLKVGASRKDGASPSLDRIDNSKGYIPGNVCVISDRANRIKNDGTAEEFERIAAWLRSYQAAGVVAK